jgi:NTE family protein
LFQAVAIENSKFVDGGLLDNFPIEPLVDHCDKIIGSHVNRLGSTDERNIQFSKTQMIERCFQLAIANSVYSKVNKCDVFVEPVLNGFGLFKMRNMERIFEIGYHAALEQKQNIVRLLED